MSSSISRYQSLRGSCTTTSVVRCPRECHVESGSWSHVLHLNASSGGCCPSVWGFLLANWKECFGSCCPFYERTSISRISKSQREIWCFATEKPAEIFTSFILSSAGPVPIPDPSACQACMLCLSKPARCPRRSPFLGECHLSIFLVLRFPRNDGFPDKSHVTCSSFKNLDDTVALPLSPVELRRSKKWVT